MVFVLIRLFENVVLSNLLSRVWQKVTHSYASLQLSAAGLLKYV